MNQTTKNQLIRVMREEVVNTKDRISEEERKRTEELRLEVDKNTSKLYKAVEAFVKKEAGKFNLTPSMRSLFQFNYNAFKEERRGNSFNERINLVDKAFQKAERDILFDQDADAKSVLADFITALKAL